MPLSTAQTAYGRILVVDVATVIVSRPFNGSTFLYIWEEHLCKEGRENYIFTEKTYRSYFTTKKNTQGAGKALYAQEVITIGRDCYYIHDMLSFATVSRELRVSEEILNWEFLKDAIRDLPLLLL